MNRIVSEKSLTKNIKQQIIAKELERYHKLKKLIEHNKLKFSNIRRKRKSTEIESPRYKDIKNFTNSEHLKYNNERTFYTKLLDNAILKLKRFIKDEIEKLKLEIQIKR
jgi:cobyric acid synthase